MGLQKPLEEACRYISFEGLEADLERHGTRVSLFDPQRYLDELSEPPPDADWGTAAVVREFSVEGRRTAPVVNQRTSVTAMNIAASACSCVSLVGADSLSDEILSQEGMLSALLDPRRALGPRGAAPCERNAHVLRNAWRDRRK
jgi:hypothetical protein